MVKAWSNILYPSNRFSHRLIILVALAFLTLGTLWHFSAISTRGSRIFEFGKGYGQTTSAPLIRRHVAVASTFGYHFDVYMTVAWTIQRLKEPIQLEVYAERPFKFNFDRIIEQYGIYNGTYKYPQDLVMDLVNQSPEEGIDLLILGTCEIDMRNWNDELLVAWDARDAAHKFQVVCIVHDATDTAWQDTIPAWSRRNAIRLLPISPHVGKAFHQIFQDRARSIDPVIRSAGLEYIPIDYHVPILDIMNLPKLSSRRSLSNAVIQGTFDDGRRDYPRIFSELNQSLYENPYVWGYLPMDKEDVPYSIDPNIEDPPFKLHLVGNGWITVPMELKNVIVFHAGLNYTDFYKVMGDMDICLPAFRADIEKNYKYQASSSITMCLETNVPILALQELRDAYQHINDDRVTVTRPAVMSEVEAIKALRMRDASSFLGSDPEKVKVPIGANIRVREAVVNMLKNGWIRTADDFSKHKQEIWKTNKQVIKKILLDES